MSSRFRLFLLALAWAASFTPGVAAQAADNDLGRLFFTPERRAIFDRARQFNIEEQQVSQQNIMSVDGLVVRSSGRSTAWVNGVAVSEQGRSGLVATPDPKRAAVRVRPANESGTTVVVGTSINRSTGEHLDPLGGGYVAPGSSAARK